MKQTKLVLFTAVIALCSFVAVVYSSCTRDRCSGVACQNGGTCSGGTCNCPTGYTGNLCQQSSILFTNDTYTDISLTVNGTTGTLAAGNSVSYVGTPGATAVVSAVTLGTATYGTLSWSYTDHFPTGGNSLTEPFDVSSDYFYLEMINNTSSQTITTVAVNTQTSSLTTVDNVNILNTGVIYGVGYYSAYPNTSVSASTNTGGNVSWTPYQLNLPFTANQHSLVVAD